MIINAMLQRGIQDDAARVRANIIRKFETGSGLTPVACDIDHWKWRYEDVSHVPCDMYITYTLRRKNTCHWSYIV